jgi:KDO2-lipid IV(A) lauroyltransferase
MGIEKNISRVFTNKDKKCIRNIARRVIQKHYTQLMELFKFASLKEHRLNRFAYFDGLDILDRERAKGNGIILVHMHFGTMQAPLVALGLKGYPIHQINYRNPEEKDFSFIHKKVHLRIRMRIENKFNAKHIYIGKSMRPVYNLLENNEILMITGDGIGGYKNIPKSYVPLNFLGHSMFFPPGPVKLAQSTKASIIPIFAVQQDDNRHKIIFEEPIELEYSGNRKDMLESNMKKYVKVFEKYIYKYPCHWMFWEEFKEGFLLAGKKEKIPDEFLNDDIKESEPKQLAL